MVADKALPAPLYAFGGFSPFGPASILSGVTAVILALGGAEIITIAAADAHEPGSVIARLTTTLIIRVALFYLLSMLLIVAIVPWTDIRPGDSPFALALEGVGAPRVSLIMNGVIIVAVLRSEEHTSELQSLMRISYAVFCLKTKNYKDK